LNLPVQEQCSTTFVPDCWTGRVCWTSRFRTNVRQHSFLTTEPGGFVEPLGFLNLLDASADERGSVISLCHFTGATSILSIRFDRLNSMMVGVVSADDRGSVISICHLTGVTSILSICFDRLKSMIVRVVSADDRGFVISLCNFIGWRRVSRFVSTVWNQWSFELFRRKSGDPSFLFATLPGCRRFSRSLIFLSWNFATLIVLLLIPLFYFALNLFGIIQDLWIWIVKKLACCHITLHIKLQQSAITCFQIIFAQMFSDDCITYLTQGIRRCWLEQIERGENKTSEAAIQSL